MWLIVGLGNPGAKYLFTRHNIGFMAVDYFVAGLGTKVPQREEKKAITYRLKLDDQELLFCKPQTFMNLSGESVRPLMDYYKIEIPNVIVVHDEVDLAFGAMKIQKNRSSGGHNGLKSLTEHLGTQDYTRLRLGVGKSANTNIDTATHVLQNFSQEEGGVMDQYLGVASDAIESIIFDGPDKAASNFNRAHFSEVR